MSEEFLGLYAMVAIDAQNIVEAIKDAFLHFEVPLTKLRGQSYDGCNTMLVSKGGVAARITALEPRAVFTHCYGHALNLSVGDTIKQSSAMRECLEICFEVVKLIKVSPKQEAMLRELKEEIGSDAPSVRTLCPTRWTIRAESLASIIANIQQLWEAALQAACDTRTKARIHGVRSQMKSFNFLLCLILTQSSPTTAQAFQC